MSTHPSTRYVLGLDLGVASIGWALVRFDGKKPVTVEEAGTRIFQSAMTNEKGEISQGREESRNKERRDKRLMRRQLDRRARRHRDLAVLLQSHGLLPEGSINNSAKRHELLIELERSIAARHAESIPEEERNQFYNTLPYWLRARALQERLTLDELGRTLYHLGQRRGFLSNRKTDRDEDEESGKVYGGIDELTGFMEESGCETLGQYFATVDPTEPEARRIRGRYTSRKMYMLEFDRVWESQRPHYPDLLTDALKKQIHNTIFFQRKLQSARDLIGICEYECRAKGCDVDRKRAPWALELAQRFRIIQMVNNLNYELGSGEKYQLTDTEWRTLVDKLDREGDLKFSQVKKLLDLPKSTSFNLEEGGETTLRGNRTSSKLRKVFDDRLDSFSPEDRFQIVEDLRSYEKVEALEKRGREKWGLTPEKAKEFSKINLEADYCNLSRQAMEKLLPLMEEGEYYMKAVTKVYGEQIYEWETEYLGPVADAPFGELRNPTVFRVLTQLRKVVNRIIKTYGKPDEIRVELARDVKRSKKERQNLAKRMRDQEKERQAAANLILGFDKNFKFSREDIEKVLLMQECNCLCPYTGKMISMGSLLGPNPQFEVEHIVPFSRCLDNSFFNKTLCHIEANRTKRNRTPHEAFHGTPDWDAMLERVKKFKGRGAAEKLKRFQLFGKALSESVGDFKSSQLNDTRYASRLALEYLRVLYGGDWRKRLLASKGGITAELRSAWKLNSVLNDGDVKTREDHRHHAVDAIAIALASPEMVQIVSQAAQMAEKQGHRRWWKLIQEPWEGFLGDCKTAIDRIVISHAPNKPVRGALHKETNYSPPKENSDGETVVHVRKSIEALSESEVNNIVDHAVRQSVLDKIQESGKTKPADAFKNGMNTPLHKNGKPIRKVRIASKTPVIPVGEAERQRFVSPGNNHHIEIFEQVDKKGKVKWVGRVVSLYECYRRQAKGLPVIDRVHPDGGRFVFSLCGGDMVEMLDAGGVRRLYVVRGISEFSSGALVLDFLQHTDARGITKVPRAGRTKVPNVMFQAKCRKVSVTPLGEIRYAND
jgi:CRISPR-associated endonuclease Csn1